MAKLGGQGGHGGQGRQSEPHRLALGCFLLCLGTLVSGGCREVEQATINSVEDIRFARIGVTTGSTPAQLAYERFPEAQVSEFGDSTDSLGALQAGHIDATITSINAGLMAVRHNPDLRLLETTLREEQTCAAVRKGNEALRAQVNRVIRKLRQNGTLADMSRRWFKQQAGPYEEPEYQLPTTGKPLRVGVSATREPFSFVDQQGRVTGHDGELARALSVELGRPLEFMDTRWDALIPALQAGKIDIIVTGMSYSAERAERIDFTDSYYNNKLVVLTRVPAGHKPAATKRLAATDLATAKVGVLQGSAHDVFAQKNWPGAELLHYTNYADLLVAVEGGKVAGGISDIDPLREAMRTKPGFQPLQPTLFSSEVAAGFRRDNVRLRRQFDEFLYRLSESGEHAAFLHRWREASDFDMPVLDMPVQGEPLRVGNAILGLPQVAVRNGELVGLDVELAQRFGLYLKRPVEFVTLDWQALIPALTSGKIDVVISSMFATPERRERIAFSHPYYKADVVAFVHRPVSGVGQPQTQTQPGFWASAASSFHSNIIREDRYLLLWDGLKTTIWLSLWSTLLGTLLGGVVCFMRMSPLKVMQLPAKVYISVMRGTPVLVLLMLIFYVIFASSQISPVVVAVVAFGLNFAAYVAEIFRSGVRSIDPGQTEAGLAMGFSKLATFIHIVLPQTVQRILPVYKGEFISLVKMTSIVGYVAVHDLTKASDIIRSRTFDAFFPIIMVAVLYYLIAVFLTHALEYVEKMTDPQRRRRI